MAVPYIGNDPEIEGRHWSHHDKYSILHNKHIPLFGIYGNKMVHLTDFHLDVDSSTLQLLQKLIQ